MSKVVLPQVGKEIEVAEGQTILDAALESGIDYPHSCRKGRCGACKSMLLRGAASMQRPYSRFALSDEELKSGVILACRAVPIGRAEVAWSAAEGEDSVTSLAGKVSGLELVTHDIMRVLLRLDRPFSFRPGQYALLKFGSCERRSYSMASLPEDELVEFHIRHVPGGSASSYVRSELRLGDNVEVTGPLGNGFLREEKTPRIVAIAGGSGLAPIKSIVRRALQIDVTPDLRLYHGVRAERDLYGECFFQDLAKTHPGLAYTPVLSSELGVTSRRTGLVGDAVIADGSLNPSVTVYMAGPRAMIESLFASLRAAGVDEARIFADAFE